MQQRADPHKADASLRQISKTRYQRHAAGYDASARFTMPLRERTISLLQLQPGDVVLDVGAGTGLSYPLLSRAVGPTGRVLAFEQSPAMFEQACARVRDEGLSNVWHVQASAHDVQLPCRPGAVLFNYVHDITRMPDAVANILRQADTGARIALAGMKYFPWWTGPLNILAWLKNRPYNALAADMWTPWDRVEPYCESFERWTTHCGMGYIARGRLRRDDAAAKRTL